VRAGDDDVGPAQLAAVRVERRLRPEALERPLGRRRIAVREQPRRRRVEVGPHRASDHDDRAGSVTIIDA
jgi:hypothetical protein